MKTNRQPDIDKIAAQSAQYLQDHGIIMPTDKARVRKHIKSAIEKATGIGRVPQPAAEPVVHLTQDDAEGLMRLGNEDAAAEPELTEREDELDREERGEIIGKTAPGQWTVPDLLDWMPSLLVDEAEQLTQRHNSELESERQLRADWNYVIEEQEKKLKAHQQDFGEAVAEGRSRQERIEWLEQLLADAYETECRAVAAMEQSEQRLAEAEKQLDIFMKREGK